MKNIELAVEIPVLISDHDLDEILFTALNAGGVAEWADRVVAVGGKLGERICEQISKGGTLSIHERTGEWQELTIWKLIDGIEMYLRESCHIRIEDGRMLVEDLSIVDADTIVQFALFGEVKW